MSSRRLLIEAGLSYKVQRVIYGNTCTSSASLTGIATIVNLIVWTTRDIWKIILD